MDLPDAEVDPPASPPRRTEPHLSAAELLAFRQFYDSARLIEEAMSRQLVREHAMTLADYDVLFRLDRAGCHMRLPVLADRCVTSVRELTQSLVRLEDQGFIRREKVTGDARGALAHLLPAGTEKLEAAGPALVEIIKERLLSCWTPDEVDLIGRAMDASATRLRELRR